MIRSLMPLSTLLLLVLVVVAGSAAVPTHGNHRSGWRWAGRHGPNGNDDTAAISAGRRPWHHDGHRGCVGAGRGAAHIAYARTHPSNRCAGCSRRNLPASPHAAGIEVASTTLWDLSLVWCLGRSCSRKPESRAIPRPFMLCPKLVEGEPRHQAVAGRRCAFFAFRQVRAHPHTQ